MSSCFDAWALKCISLLWKFLQIKVEFSIRLNDPAQTLPSTQRCCLDSSSPWQWNNTLEGRAAEVTVVLWHSQDHMSVILFDEEKDIQQQPPNSSFLGRWMKAGDIRMKSVHQGTVSWKSTKQPMLLMSIKSKDENRKLQNIINFLPGRLELAVVSNRELWNVSSSLERDQQWNILVPSNKPPSTRFWRIPTVKNHGWTKYQAEKLASPRNSGCCCATLGLNLFLWKPTQMSQNGEWKFCFFFPPHISCSQDVSAKAKYHCWQDSKRSSPNPQENLNQVHQSTLRLHSSCTISCLATTAA